MKGLVWTFVLGATLLVGTYAVMIGAVTFPGFQSPRRAEAPALGTPRIQKEARSNGDTVTLTREAAQNVIDCYAGKPVYLQPGSRRPLYPPCDELLRIYMDLTTDPDEVLALLADAK